MKSLRIIFAVEDEAERAAFSAVIAAASAGHQVFFPANIADVEKLYKSDGAEAIVTDLRFHNGALADWLTFWPLPAVLLTDPGDDPERIERTIRDEASLFLERRADYGHLSHLSILLHKVVNIRESVRRQNAHLTMTEHQYLNLLQAIPDIVYILDNSGHFIYLNDAIRSLGFEPTKLLGKHFSEIVHPSDVGKVSRIEVLQRLKGSCTGGTNAPKLFDERRSGERMTRNLELRLRQGKDTDGFLYGSVNAYGEVSCTGYQLPEFEGKDMGTVGIVRDISARKAHEREIEEALAAKEILLKEIHHRVKNNLQVVSSLLNLQEAVVSDEVSRKVFLECQTQIQSMAMVHEILYHSNDFQGVDMQKYFERLVEYLAGVYDGTFHGIQCAVEAPAVSLDLDSAIAIALITNELVSNCYKHAFPGGRRGRVIVSMSPRGEDWLLSVADDGVGFAKTRRSEGETGIGTELVHALAAQLRGTIELDSDPPIGLGGSLTQIRFPRPISA